MVSKDSIDVMGRICGQLTCPHFVIRGAVGGERHIGHVVWPSTSTDSSPGAVTDANADERGMITCKISCHWKKLCKQISESGNRNIEI